MATFDLVRDLPVRVESLALERLEKLVSRGFTRVTTVVRLAGGGHEGIGEDVCYGTEDQDAFQAAAGSFRVEGEFTIASLSEHLDTLELFPVPASQGAYRDYRRWAFESAALDLALRQAGESLADRLGRTLEPLQFVVSLALPEPASIAPLTALRERYPQTRFKLDPTPSWSRALMDEIHGLGGIEVLDLKGHYSGTIVDVAPSAELYLAVAEAFPGAWIEDAKLTPATDDALAPHCDRLTWDAPIHCVADIEELRYRPRMLNIKPSRFATIERLLDAYDWCAANGVGMYGGGQFELGPGRGQIQYLASLFHPATPNDVAPTGYNESPAPDGLPVSPLAPAPTETGFRFR